jgi:hypothetical protein
MANAWGKEYTKSLDEASLEARLEAIKSGCERYTRSSLYGKDALTFGYNPASYGLWWVVNSGRISGEAYTVLRNMTTYQLCELVHVLLTACGETLEGYTRFIREYCRKKAPTPDELTDPRYIVEKAQASTGYAIIDTKGRDEPYLIDAMHSLRSYERQALTPAAIERYEEHNKKVAEQWAYTWNLVELGYCGACKALLAAIKGHENERYPAVGYNKLYRTVCFACACSQED